MAKKTGFSLSKTAMWIILGLLIVGLAGFSAANLGGNIRTIGTVGDKSVSVDAYARQLQQEMRAISQQTGQPLPFATARQIGLDRAVLQRVVRDRAMDHEADVMGLSIGDDTLRARLLEIPAFQGPNGTFDREGYRYALRNTGMNESEFETSLREEAARTLVQGAVAGGIEMPAIYAETLVSYIAQKRSFVWSTLEESDLDAPIVAPDDATLKTYYDENAGDFRLPDTKRLTYIWLSPDDVMDQVEVPEEELRQAYADRDAEFNQPERRLVERLPFGDQNSAERAAAALEVDGTSFEALVEERGLQLGDVDLGDVALEELDAAGEAVFAAKVGDVVGPFATPLGPALFRVNGVLPALATSFEDAQGTLRDTLAAARAVRLVEAQAQDLDDFLAGGSTLEQLAEENDLRLGTVDWTTEASDGIAAYGNFREAAAAVSDGDFPKIDQLEDGGLFAIRLDEFLEERPNPFEDAKPDVLAAWTSAQTVSQLTAQAEALVVDLTSETAFTEAGLDAVVEVDQTRGAFIENAPEGFLEAVFEMAPGDVRVLPGADSVAIIRLEEITAADDDEQAQALQTQLSAQINQALAQDVFSIYASDVVLRAGPEIDQRALDAVHLNFQ